MAFHSLRNTRSDRTIEALKVLIYYLNMGRSISSGHVKIQSCMLVGMIVNEVIQPLGAVGCQSFCGGWINGPDLVYSSTVAFVILAPINPLRVWRPPRQTAPGPRSEQGRPSASW